MSIFALSLLLVLAAPLSVVASERVKIATVPDEAFAIAGRQSEPITMAGYGFEVAEETGRARVAVDFTFLGSTATQDDVRHPSPAFAQMPGLTYDASTREVIYTQAGERTVCATVRKRGKVETTGKCVVTAANAVHAEDDGWKIRRLRVLDVYFEAR